MRALDSRASENSESEQTSQHIIVSQQANSDSKSAQFTGEVLEEATRILVREFGLVTFILLFYQSGCKFI